MQKKPNDILNFPQAKDSAVAPASQKADGKVGSNPYNSNSLASVPKPPSENCPFRRLVKEWLAAGRASGLSPKTIEDYQEKVFKFWWWWDKFYASELGAHPKNVSVREARAYATYLREPQDYRWGITTTHNNRPLRNQPLSSASIASYGRSVKVFFSWLEQEGYIESSPFRNKSVRFTSRKRDTVVKKVSEEDLTRLFATLTATQARTTYAGSRNLAIVALLFDSGIRRGELLSMRLEDLDLEKGRCIIRGKTGQRTAIFSELCKATISEYWQNYRIFQDTKPSSAFWLTPEGTPLSDGGFGMVIRRIEEASGVDFHAHKLRHTYASMLARKVDLFTLKELMGHSSITTTQIYVHGDIEKLQGTFRPHSPLAALATSQPDSGVAALKRKRGKRKQAD